MRYLLQLVRGPVAKVERTRGPHLERVAAGGDVVEVQLGAPADEMFHRVRLERGQLVRIAFQRFKKCGVADAGDLHGLDVAAAFVFRFQRGEQVEIVDDGVRRGKGAYEILLTE